MLRGMTGVVVGNGIGKKYSVCLVVQGSSSSSSSKVKSEK
jgi:hypothetical protein